MIKAGLTDPGRPLGVFLFTGPTGTGKTEIAKTLAAFLFGSSERMLRLDMSEFQSPESVARLLGDREDVPGSTALVHEIRRQPFAVVLLDEVEKAHPSIHDLFLQVFDDGRLTDRRGRTADFRHAILIMTSNVGATATRRAAMTFGAAHSVTGVDPAVEKALLAEFRPELLNRIDRIVVFRSLDRADMRRVLDKELRGVLERRGLRDRQWAVEWDDSAHAFLLDRGFSPELGARPLRRTIERYLLAPLAKTIAQRRAPNGDQFLFVRSDGRGLQVEFVDPDAPDPEPAPETIEPGDRDVPAIAFEPRGTAAEVELLRRQFAELHERTNSDDWQRQKAADLEAMAGADFWTSPERWRVLGRAEYLDRIGVGVDTAERLLARVCDHDGRPRAHPRRDLVGRLAERVHLLSRALDGLDAGLPADALVRVEAVLDGQPDPDAVNAAARRVGAMYRAWAETRGMEIGEVGESTGESPYRLELAITGFGAYPILAEESGLHVFEVIGRGGTIADRLRVRVTVAPQPDDAAPGERNALARAIWPHAEMHRTRIVRRYREGPSPLARDAVRGWRTGRVERVLGGDFDLLS